MKSYTIEPSEFNIIDCFLNDSIGRNNQVYYAWDILCNTEDVFAVSIDGDWGSGKTFFVKQLKLFFDAINESLVVEDDQAENGNNHDADSIKKKVEEIINKRGKYSDGDTLPASFRSIYYDAWAADADKDPVLSLIFTIIKELGLKQDLKDDSAIRSILCEVLDYFLPIPLFNSIDRIMPENYLEEIEREKQISTRIQSFFDTLCKEQGNRIIIFIDELDRCKPDYAVLFLERIKHYLVSSNIIFVFSVNFRELQKTICQFYGQEFDATRYLDRFFDLRLTIPQVDIEKYYNYIGFSEDALFDDICKVVIRKYHFQMRETSRYLRIVHLAAYLPTHQANIETTPIFDTIIFCLTYFLPIAIGLHLISADEFRGFMNGQGVKHLDVIQESEWAKESLPAWLGDRPSSERVPISPGETEEDKMKRRLEECYQIVFSGSLPSNKEKQVGKIRFNNTVISKVREAISGLSLYSQA